MFKLVVINDDPERFFSTTVWSNFCTHVKESAKNNKSVSLIDELSAQLRALNIKNIPEDDGIYFETEAALLMFVLRWS